VTKFLSEKIFRKKKVEKHMHFGGAKYSKNFACGGKMRGGGVEGNPFPPTKNNAICFLPLTNFNILLKYQTYGFKDLEA
jgi:hypothetical protein